MADTKDPLATAVDASTSSGNSGGSDFKSFLASTGLPTGAEVTKERQQAFEAYKARRAPLLAEQDRLMKQMTDINESMQKIQAPKAPELQDIPKPPDETYRDPMQALGSLATVLAVFGSMKTRAPLTAALNAAASSMQGFHQGDQEKVKLEQQKWKDNLFRGLQQNQLEMQKYMNALKAANFDVAKAQNAFRLIAAEYDHVSMKAAVETHDFETQMGILSAGLNAGEKGAQLMVTFQEKEAQLEAARAYREATLGTRQTEHTRSESFKVRAEYEKRAKPIQDELATLDHAESLLRGATPGEKLLGIRELQHFLGSNRLKLDASQMQNFGDLAQRIEGWASKGLLGKLTDEQYQQLFNGIQTLRGLEQSRMKAVEDDTRNVVKSAKLDSGIVFGESSDDTGAETPEPGGKDLDYFLGKR